MYTIGSISKFSMKTFSYTSFEEANKEFKIRVKCFKLNNAVESSTTIIDRDSADIIIGIKTIFRIFHDPEDRIIFLSRSSN